MEGLLHRNRRGQCLRRARERDQQAVAQALDDVATVGGGLLGEQCVVRAPHVLRPRLTELRPRRGRADEMVTRIVAVCATVPSAAQRLSRHSVERAQRRVRLLHEPAV